MEPQIIYFLMNGSYHVAMWLLLSPSLAVEGDPRMVVGS